ncbi:hypothetical protein, partial [Escherichia coli]|uniref:hypothetical protein n=1 Tax=Escherichia coli TaxID=562 RepID=UPI001F0333F6
QTAAGAVGQCAFVATAASATACQCFAADIHHGERVAGREAGGAVGQCAFVATAASATACQCFAADIHHGERVAGREAGGVRE